LPFSDPHPISHAIDTPHRDEMVHRQEFQDVLDHIKYIEKKLGIESGV
jgi:hypothetical protein